MEEIKSILQKSILEAFKVIYNHELAIEDVLFQTTRKDIEGDLTLVVFPLVKYSKKTPETTAEDIGKYIMQEVKEVQNFTVLKGFLNITIKHYYWCNFITSVFSDTQFGKASTIDEQPIIIEYSSPNTNKPLHLGHIRNNLLGWSLAELLKANGQKVVKVNLINDRGIHICKSMLAYNLWGNNTSPELENIKSDHFVGDYYVKFDSENKKELELLKGSDNQSTENDDDIETNLMHQARKMLLEWEAGNQEIIDLWKRMNLWATEGFRITYQRMGIDFDKEYLESETYLLGKKMVYDALQSNKIFKKEDGSVWIDLSTDGLDEKLLLRADGTSVYITQDLGTAQLRYDDYKPKEMIYVVGNEQDYHFNVLKLVLTYMDKPWASMIRHFSYGMVRLPDGKMKSREGKVVDADDLMQEMFETAKFKANELGKISEFTEEEKNELYEIIGMGALKYFILRVDPKKTILFNPEESIDLNGNTGPFIQYTHARICSVLRKAKTMMIQWDSNEWSTDINIDTKELNLIKLVCLFTETISDAAKTYNPALIANYVYELSKMYNQFYHDLPILPETNTGKRILRLQISQLTATVLKNGLAILGITAPEKM